MCFRLFVLIFIYILFSVFYLLAILRMWIFETYIHIYKYMNVYMYGTSLYIYMNTYMMHHYIWISKPTNIVFRSVVRVVPDDSIWGHPNPRQNSGTALEGLNCIQKGKTTTIRWTVVRETGVPRQSSLPNSGHHEAPLASKHYMLLRGIWGP